MKIHNSSHVGRKKFVYFGPQTKKLLTLIYLHPNGLFSGDYILALRGCCPLKFLHTLEIDKGLLAHTRRCTGGPPPKKKSRKLKICLKIQRASFHNFRNSGSIFTKLFHATCHYCERNFVFLKLILHSDLRRRAGRPHVWLCHARLVACCYTNVDGEVRVNDKRDHLHSNENQQQLKPSKYCWTHLTHSNVTWRK